MIQSFKCADTLSLYEGHGARRFGAIRPIAERKLQMLDSAASLDALRAPPGNRLEALKGDRAGQYSIRINSRWRVCFAWTPDGPEAVEIVDYH
jgi:proteic killer suppression protein